MKKFFVNLLVIFLLSITSFGTLYAKTILPGLIGNDMVLKQKSKVAFWGWDKPGMDISVETSWNNRKYVQKPDWMVNGICIFLPLKLEDPIIY